MYRDMNNYIIHVRLYNNMFNYNSSTNYTVRYSRIMFILICKNVIVKCVGNSLLKSRM